jgi:hypothetical protein
MQKGSQLTAVRPLKAAQDDQVYIPGSQGELPMRKVRLPTDIGH